MSDETKVVTPAAPTPAPAKTIEAPMLSWMRGGTLTSAYESQLAQQKADAEKSRQVEDARTRAAEQSPDNAKQYKKVVGGNKRFPGIVLEFREPRDHKVIDYIECELHVLDDGSLMLQMSCVDCYHRAGITENLSVRQTHRHFELDVRRRGELWVNPKDPRHIVTLAGTIHLTERVMCPNLGCGKQFLIDDSVLRYV